MSQLIYGIPLLGLAGLISGGFLLFLVRRAPVENQRLRDTMDGLRDQVLDILKRQYLVICPVGLLIFAALSFGVSVQSGFAFLLGCGCALYIVWIAILDVTYSVSKTIQAALSREINQTFSISVTGNFVIGLSGSSLGLLSVGILLVLLDQKVILPAEFTAFALGVSSIVLFFRIGGGIFSKVADIGGDQVGKIEAGIEENDPRNPAAQLDQIGDFFSGGGGASADIFESYVVSIVAAIVVAATGSSEVLEINPDNQAGYLSLPIILATVGLLSSCLGISFLRFLKRLNPSTAIRTAVILSGSTFLAGSALALNACGLELGIVSAIFMGTLSGVVVSLTSEWYMLSNPLQRVAESNRTGMSTSIARGLAFGLQSAVTLILMICGTLLIAYNFAGIYGIAISAVAMMGTVGMTMTLCGFGCTADSSSGVSKIAGYDSKTDEVTEALDIQGSVTGSTGTILSVGSAVLVSFALFTTFAEVAGLQEVNVLRPIVIIGLIVGGILPLLVGGLILAAVSKASMKMIAEIRRQFHQIPGLIQGTADPESVRCREISAANSLKQMVIPGLVAILTPVLIGLTLGNEALGGFVVGTLVVGVVGALLMINSGGVWENSMKLIESGFLGGKDSATHRSSVMADLVGDPLKDIVGPAWNILIKLVPIIALVVAPLLR